MVAVRTISCNRMGAFFFLVVVVVVVWRRLLVVGLMECGACIIAFLLAENQKLVRIHSNELSTSV